MYYETILWNNVGCDNLAADAVDVLLNLGHPLSEHSEQLGNGGSRVQENLSALRLAWVEEGELCGWWRERGKVITEIRLNCDVSHPDW